MCKCNPENEDKSCELCRGGRPLLYPEPEKLEEKCNGYFEEVDSKNLTEKVARPYLVSGLALFLGMDSDSLLEYAKRDKFFGIIKRAKEKISLNLQERSIIDPRAAVGCLFNLKCNHGMIEKKHVEVSGPDGGPIKNEIEYVDPRDEE